MTQSTMAKTALLLDETLADHQTGPGHPECPERLAVITHALQPWKSATNIFPLTAGGRVVSVLEGGYNLRGLGVAVAAHVAELTAA